MILLSVALAILATTAGAVARFSGRPPTKGPISADGVIKAPLAGLLQQNGMPVTGYGPLISGFAVTVKWSALQPVAGGPIASNNPIDHAITLAQQYNAANPGANMRIKLRVLAGINAPNWAKQLGGAPVSVHDPTSKVSGTIGRFWTAPFGQAYDTLQTELAAKYDAVPEIAEVTAARCTTVYAEPFIRDIADAATVQNLLAAGFTTTADHACIDEQFQAHNVWTQTLTGVAFGPYNLINPDGTTALDFEFPQSMISDCRQVLGARCVIENDHLTSTTTNQMNPVLIAMALAGEPNGFQTASCKGVGNIPVALQNSVSLGFRAVELCSGYESLATPTQLQPFPAALATGTYAPELPIVKTSGGSATSTTTATMRGAVNSRAVPGTVVFEYGTSTAYGQTVTVTFGTTNTLTAVSANVTGLAPATIYHYRIRATTVSGSSTGNDVSFRTPKT